jgi:hypothetical protein
VPKPPNAIILSDSQINILASNILLLLLFFSLLTPDQCKSLDYASQLISINLILRNLG